MTDPRVYQQMLNELTEIKKSIVWYEHEIEIISTEIAKREGNNDDTEELKKLKKDKTGHEGALRTLKVLKGAQEVAMELGTNAAGAWLGENIGKK